MKNDSLEHIKNRLYEAKQRFINEVTVIANECDIPIEVIVESRDSPYFFRQGQRHPFDLIVTQSERCVTNRDVLGKQSIIASQLSAIEHEKICT